MGVRGGDNQRALAVGECVVEISARVEDSAEGCARCEASFGNWGEPNGTVGYRYLDRSLLDFGKTLALRMGAGSAT